MDREDKIRESSSEAVEQFEPDVWWGERGFDGAGWTSSPPYLHPRDRGTLDIGERP